MSMNQTVLSTIPTNLNFLSPIPYKLIMSRTPNLDYFVQKINLPGVSSMNAVRPTAFTDIPYSGVKLNWNPLFVTFKCDEELANWQEIFNWITAINDAKSFEPYEKLNENPSYTGLNVTSELTLIVHDNERNPNYNVFFHTAFPISLTDVTFDATQTDINYLTASVTFRYSTYDLQKVQ